MTRTASVLLVVGFAVAHRCATNGMAKPANKIRSTQGMKRSLLKCFVIMCLRVMLRRKWCYLET